MYTPKFNQVTTELFSSRPCATNPFAILFGPLRQR